MFIKCVVFCQGQNITISNYALNPSSCAGYTTLCRNNVYRDITIGFQLASCSSTTTTQPTVQTTTISPTTLPAGCSCTTVSRGLCNPQCGPGFQNVTQFCVGISCPIQGNVFGVEPCSNLQVNHANRDWVLA